MKQGIATIVIICYDFTIAGQDREKSKKMDEFCKPAVIYKIIVILFSIPWKFIESILPV